MNTKLLHKLLGVRRKAKDELVQLDSMEPQAAADKRAIVDRIRAGEEMTKALAEQVAIAQLKIDQIPLRREYLRELLAANEIELRSFCAESVGELARAYAEKAASVRARAGEALRQFCPDENIRESLVAQLPTVTELVRATDNLAYVNSLDSDLETIASTLLDYARRLDQPGT